MTILVQKKMSSSEEEQTKEDDLSNFLSKVDQIGGHLIREHQAPPTDHTLSLL